MKIQNIHYLVALVAITYAPIVSAEPLQQAVLNINQIVSISPTINAGNGGSGGAGGISAGGTASGGASGRTGSGGSAIGTAVGGDGISGGMGGAATITGTGGATGNSGTGGNANGGSASNANGGSGGGGSAGNSTLYAPTTVSLRNYSPVSQIYIAPANESTPRSNFTNPKMTIFGNSAPLAPKPRNGGNYRRFGQWAAD